MFKNNQKNNIGKFLLIAVFIVCLLFTVVNYNIEYSFAVDLNETTDNMELKINGENNLEYSNDFNESLKEYSNRETLGRIITTTGGSFNSLQNIINRIDDGDTIKIHGNYVAKPDESVITLNKSISLITIFGGSLNANGTSSILNITAGAEGCIISNLVFCNAVGHSGSAIVVGTSNVTLNNLKFTNNHCELDGIIKIESNAENVTLNNCIFTNNSGYFDDYANLSYASAISVYALNCNITGCTFESNWVRGTNGTCNGVLKIYKCTNITNCIFKNNNVFAVNGLSYGGVCSDDNVNYINCLFVNNTAGHGGAVFLNGNSCLINCSFINNTADMYGGAILVNSSQFTLDNLKFEGNSAQEGGACYINQSDFIFSNSFFKNNHAIRGGALTINSNNVVVKNSTFSSNMAIPNDYNLSMGLGGALYIKGSETYVDNCQFKCNQAINGSAIYIDNIAEGTILQDDTFTNNLAYLFAMNLTLSNINYGDVEQIKLNIKSGDNIAGYNISKAIYNAANINEIKINGETPVMESILNGFYQSDLGNNLAISIVVQNDDGVVYNDTLNSSYLGEINFNLENLKSGNYEVIVKYFNYSVKDLGIVSTFKVNSKADTKIKISTNSTVYNFSDVIVWTLNITNNGPSNASNITVNCLLDDGLIYQYGDGPGVFNSKIGLLTINKLNANQSVLFNIFTKVNRTGEFQIKVNITSQDVDLNLIDNYDNKTIKVNPASDLIVTTLLNKTVYNYGDKINYTVIVKNNGPDIASKVSVQIMLMGINKSWDIESIGIGEEQIFNMGVIANYTGLIENNVVISSLNFDFNKSNNKKSIDINVNPMSNLEIDANVNSSNINYHDVIKVTITAINKGLDNATDVKIETLIPEGLVYLNSTLNSTNIGNLSVNQKIMFDIFCKVNATGYHTFYLNVRGNEFDYCPNNNNKSILIFVNPSSDLDVKSSVNCSNVNYSDLITYTIRVKNNGPDTANDIIIEDLINDYLIYVNDTSLGNYNSSKSQWEINSLNVGDEISLNITFRVNNTGLIVKKVNINSTVYDYYPMNNNDSVSIFVNPASDLVMYSYINSSHLNYYNLVKLSLIVKNNGLNNATDVIVSNILPNGFSYINSTFDYLDNKFNIGNVSVGQQIIIDIYCKVNGTGDLINCANVSSKEYDYNLTNNDDLFSIKINQSSDLEISEKVSTLNPKYLDLINITITVKNNGPNIAHNLKVHDLLPESLIYVDYAFDDTYNNIDGFWNINELDVGAECNLTIQCKVYNSGIIVNDVTVVCDEYDYNLKNNNDSISLMIENVTDLSLISSINVSNVNYGDVVKLTFKITNNGFDNASGIKIINVLPDSLVYADSSFDGIINVEMLEAGQHLTFDIDCMVIGTGYHLIYSNITGNEFDYNLENNHAYTGININFTSDLELSQYANILSSNYGDLVMFTITVKNNGINIAHDVVVCDVLPVSLDYVSSNGDYDNLAGLWNVGQLNVGESSILVILCKIVKTGVIVNDVGVNAREFDYNQSNNGASASIIVNPASDLLLSLVVNDSSVNYGDMVKLTVNVLNNGLDNASDVQVNVLLSESLIFDDSSFDGVINIDKLLVGQFLVFEINCRVVGTDSLSVYSNVSANEFDYDLSNNCGCIDININSASDLLVNQYVNNLNPNFNDLVNFTIVVVNNGFDVAHDVVVCDILPVSLDYVSSNGDYDNLAGLWNVGQLNIGESRNLVIACRINNTGDIIHKVNVTSTNFDPDLSNNEEIINLKVNSTSDLSITSYVDSFQIRCGDFIKVSLLISNNGLNDSNNIKIVNILSDGLKYVNSSFDGIININQLKSGQSTIIDLDCIITGIGVMSVSSNISCSEFDYDLSNNYDSIYLNSDSVSDLEIIIEINNYNLNYHDNINLTFIVKNKGVCDAHGVVVYTDLPSSLIYIDDTADGKYVYKTGKWNIGDLSVGCNSTLTISCKINNTGLIICNSNVTCLEYDYKSEDNYCNLSIYVNSASDLEVIKKINQTNVKYGDLVNWTVIIKNNGPDIAHNIFINNLIPDELYTVNLIGNPDGIIDSLSVGEEIEFNIIGIIDSTGLIENNVSAYCDEFDYISSNNYNNNVISVNLSCDLLVKVSTNITKANYQDMIKLTINVTNIGPDNASGVKVENILPKDFIYINSTLNIINNTLVVGNLSSQKTIAIDIIAKINGTGNYINTAKVNANEIDYYYDNNINSVSIEVSDASDLAIVNFADTSKLKSENLINWTITVKNNGPNRANGIKVSNILPDSLFFVGDDSNGYYNPESGIWNITSLDSNDEISLKITSRIIKTGIINYVVNVSSKDFDYNLNNNDYNLTIDVDATVDLSVDISVNNTSPKYGDLVKVTIIASNCGLNKAYNVEISKNISDNLVIINSTVTKGYFNESSWILESLDGGDVERLEIIYKINKTGELTNRIFIKSEEYDSNLTNNNAYCLLNIPRCVDLEVIQYINDKNYTCGEKISVMIFIKNKGINNATNINLNNVLYDSLIFNEYSASKGSYNNGTWSIDFLNAGDMEYLNITYIINSTGIISTNVEVNSTEYDLNISNNFNTIEFNVLLDIDVLINEYVNNTNPKLGDLVKFTINVSNKGLDKATSVKIFKSLVEGLIVLNTTVTKGTYEDDYWFECCLEESEIQTLELICKVNKTGVIVHNVSITADGYDKNLTNNKDYVVLMVQEVLKFNNTINSTEINSAVIKDNNVKSTVNPKIIAKKVINIIKSAKATKIKILLKGSKITSKKNIKFKGNGKKNVSVKLSKSLNGKKVTINVNGENYKVKVNKNGIVRFKVSKKLKQNRYYLGVAFWKGYKLYKNKKVTVKFNGKIYNIITNKKSVAIFKVTKKMVKNIKKGKKVQYTISYGSDKLNRFIKIK